MLPNKLNKQIHNKSYPAGVITAYDPKSRTIIKTGINAFKDYENSKLGIACTVKNGDFVNILEKKARV